MANPIQPSHDIPCPETGSQGKRTSGIVRGLSDYRVPILFILGGISFNPWYHRVLQVFPPIGRRQIVRYRLVQRHLAVYY